MLAVDLFFFRGEHEVTLKEALVWSVIWTVVGVGFVGVIYLQEGSTAAGEYLAGYVIERSLSVDNIFVFAIIFSFFGVPLAYQSKILLLGVVGAIFFRAIFIGLGAGLLETFAWMTFVFGAFLLYTAFKLLRSSEMHVDPAGNPAVKLLRRLVPVTPDYRGQRFFVKENGVRMATPLLAVVLTIATTDVVFAVDSIPAVFAVTNNTFVVFSSNAMAILGMRILYFLLRDLMDRFVYLNLGLAVVLGFVGVKMMAEEFYHMPIAVSLGIIALVLLIAVAASLVVTSRQQLQPGEGAH
jgi:tellurite resistance protein TerC